MWWWEATGIHGFWLIVLWVVLWGVLWGVLWQSIRQPISLIFRHILRGWCVSCFIICAISDCAKGICWEFVFSLWVLLVLKDFDFDELPFEFIWAVVFLAVITDWCHCLLSSLKCMCFDIRIWVEIFFMWAMHWFVLNKKVIKIDYKLLLLFFNYDVIEQFDEVSFRDWINLKLMYIFFDSIVQCSCRFTSWCTLNIIWLQWTCFKLFFSCFFSLIQV